MLEHMALTFAQGPWAHLWGLICGYGMGSLNYPSNLS